MAKRNKQAEEQPKELTPKEIRLAARKKEQDRKLYMGVGGALSLAAIILVIGSIFAFLIVPNRTFASVGDEDISTQYFWKRMRLQKNSLQSQLVNLRQLEEQFGGGGYFAGRISELESTLSNPFSLAVNTLDQLLEEKVVARYASQNSITVSDEEIDVALREEVANGQGLITEPQATETAVAGATATSEAAANATATAQAPEPTAAGAITTTSILTAGAELVGSAALTTSAVVTASEAISAATGITESAAVSAEVLAPAVDAAATVSETAAVATDTTITLTAANTETVTIAPSAEVTAAEAISAAAAISDVLPVTESVAVSESAEVIASDAISPTATPEPVPTTAVITETNFTDSVEQLETNLNDIAGLSLSDYRDIVRSRLLRDKVQEALGKDVATTEVQVKASHILLREIEPTPTPVITDTSLITPTPLPTEVPPGDPTPIPTKGPRTITEALTLSGEVSARIKAGEDFATVAQEVSEDGSASQGGDLGWFATGAMVPEFEKVAFELKPGEVSEPFTTTFGAHIVKLMERDDNRSLDDSKLEQSRLKAYSDWLEKQLAGGDIQKPEDLTANLPSDLR